MVDFFIIILIVVVVNIVEVAVVVDMACQNRLFNFRITYSDIH